MDDKVDILAAKKDHSNKSKSNEASSPIVEILLEPPSVIRRPLSLIDGQSYAVSLLDIKINTPDGASKYEHPMIIIRGDGKVFGNISDTRFIRLSKLEKQIALPELPPREKLWSPNGVMNFLQGYRANPIDVFRRLVDIISTFIDFDHSLADQATMSEFIACYILSTWFLDAFNVIGYLWPNGERGTGKTNLLILISELGYLGQLILAKGTYASLRDLADCGATLCFDDAENLSDPKQADPDKQALLLAGNRRGTKIPVKERIGDKGWRIRYVDAYCPRAFSAIRLPDPVLASRTIIIPLTRTLDKNKGNIDPADHQAWPCEYRVLLDDLWAMATVNLPRLKECNDWVGKNTQLTGRNLQPWRAILSVAYWLDSIVVEGLYARMEALSISYQTERLDIETSDLTILAIRAIIRCAVDAINSNSAINYKNLTFIMTASDVMRKAHSIIDDEDADISKEFVTSRSVGRIMVKLRLIEVPRPGGVGNRRRSLSMKELNRISQAYGIPLPDELQVDVLQRQEPNCSDGIDSSNGTVVTIKQTTFNDFVDAAPYPDISKPCFACSEMNWKLHPDGKTYYCGTCYPT